MKVTPAPLAALLALTLPLSALAAVPAAAPPKTTAIPAIGVTKPLNLPPIVERTLPNGLRLVILEDHRQPAVWMRLALPAGSIRDPQSKVGLATMTAGLLNKGTATRTQEQIAATVDRLGATLGADADDDYLVVSANGLTPYASTLLDLMADITLHPAFDAKEVDRLRTQTLSGIRAALGTPATLADAAAARLVYGAHPYGNFSTGTPETVAQITPDDVKAFQSAYFVPNGATFFIAGDITPKKAEALVSGAFGTWEKKDLPPLPDAPTAAAAANDSKPQITIIDRPGSAQTELRIATLAPGYGDASRIPAQVATAVLGLGQFEGRLTKEIRVKRGLTYGAGSTFARKKQAGEFYISTFTKNASTGQVVSIALGEVNKLKQTPPPTDELTDRKRFLTGSFSVSVADPGDLISRLQTYTLLGGGAGDLAKYTQRVDAVTPAQVRDIMAQVPLGQAQIVLVGDAKAIESQVSSIGPVTVISQEDLDLQSPTLKAVTAAPQAGTAAPAAAATPEDTAAGKALLDAAITAHGGDAFLAVKSLQATGAGELTPPGSDAALPIDSLTLTTSAPDRLRLEMTVGPVGQIVLGAPGGGKSAWVLFGGGVQDQPVGGGFGDPTAILRQARTDNYPIRSLSGETKPAADGKALQGFALTDPKGRVTNVYVESDTHLVRRIETKQGAANGTVLLGTYKPYGGVQLPGQITLSANGQNVLNLTLKTYTINPTVADGLFARPKE